MRKSISGVAARFPRLSAALCFGAASAALIGHRLVDPARTRTVWQARALGAVTSLVACVIFAIAYALWIQSSNAARHGPLSFLAYVPFVAVFSFLAVGWALMLVSVLVGWALFRLLPPTR